MPAEVFIYGVIADDWYSRYTSVAMVQEALAAIGKKERVLARINSPGGDVFVAQAMMMHLAEHPGGVDVQIDGLAASAASQIALVGETVKIAAGGRAMIHLPWTHASGDYVEFEKVTAFLKGCAETLSEEYSKRTEKSAAEMLAAMRNETWYSADEAIAAGLADGKIETVKARACAVPKTFGYRNMPVCSMLAMEGPPRAKALQNIETATDKTKAAAARQRQLQLAKVRPSRSDG